MTNPLENMALRVVAVAATTVAAPIVVAGVCGLGIQDVAKAVSAKTTNIYRRAIGTVMRTPDPPLDYDDYCD